MFCEACGEEISPYDNKAKIVDENDCIYLCGKCMKGENDNEITD